MKPPFCNKPIQTLLLSPPKSYETSLTSAETAAPRGSAEVRSNLQAAWLPMAT